MAAPARGIRAEPKPPGRPAGCQRIPRQRLPGTASGAVAPEIRTAWPGRFAAQPGMMLRAGRLSIQDGCTGYTARRPRQRQLRSTATARGTVAPAGARKSPNTRRAGAGFRPAFEPDHPVAGSGPARSSRPVRRGTRWEGRTGGGREDAGVRFRGRRAPQDRTAAERRKMIGRTPALSRGRQKCPRSAAAAPAARHDRPQMPDCR